MITNLIKKIFGSRNQRVIKKLTKKVQQINELEAKFAQLTDAQLKSKTAEFKERLGAGVSLDELLPEAFAAVREAAKRTLNMRHFDVQLIGGMVLHHGNIAEMLTGEGKTLVATLPAYLNALTGNGVHMVTVNDYLAKRDAQWMEPIYNALDMTVGVNVAGLSHEEKQAAYRADITFGTNNEYGFDYLRDNMAFALEHRVQRGLSFAIVDEVDSILIDEARTPLIISGPTEDSSERYMKIDGLIPSLAKREEEEGAGDYYLDEKAKQAFLTEQGHQTVEKKLVEMGLLEEGESLYDAANISLMHHVGAALKAHTLFHRDVDYIVRDGEVIIVDEHTGRLMQGRRWSDGLHQAVEAKEKAQIQNENQTLASITFQNYFRSYDKLAGMTGTADTEAYEFHQIYGLEVVVIPPNRPVARKDFTDKVYLTREEKFKAIIEEIKICREKGQPVLVGTASIESSELVSQLLNKNKISHQVLNAKQHEREAHIIAQAGRPGAVTIATNMAGRGTDIVLGGNLKAQLEELESPTEEQVAACREQWQQVHDQVVAAGGLHVLGTERHESRRIDNQLRGRSGRQGDPGSSRFYLSLEDNLLRIFAGEKLYNLMQKLGVPKGEALESSMLTRVIENAQRKVEGYNFDVRKQLLEYDNVANEQRKVVYSQRTDIMGHDDLSETISAIIEHAMNSVVEQFILPESFVEQWQPEELQAKLAHEFAIELPLTQWLEEEDQQLGDAEIKKRVLEAAAERMKTSEELAGSEALRRIEKSVLLQVLDAHWKEHLAAMDHLRQGIHLRGYAQKNPKQEYKRESFELFSSMLENLKIEVASILLRLQVESQQQIEAIQQQRTRQAAQELNLIHEQSAGVLQEEQELQPQKAMPITRGGEKVGRNAACPCGSGKKYKHCHGSLQYQQ